MKLGPILFEEKERSQVNSLILGSIGYGKSRFLEYLIRQDIERRQPLILIDFHGPVFDHVKAWCAYNAFYNRKIVIIDPAQGLFAKGFNPFRKREGFLVSTQTSSMIDALLAVWGEKTSTQVIFKLLKVGFTIMIEQGLTIYDVFLLLSNKDACTAQINKSNNQVIKALWRDLLKFQPAQWSSYVAPTINKMLRIVESETMQRFMCINTPGYNYDLTFEDIVLVNLSSSGNLSIDEANTFGALFLNEIYQAAMRRQGKYGKDPSPCYVYVDEWIQAPSPDYHRLLKDTRKKGVLMVLSNQDHSQIKDVFGEGFAQTILTLCQLQICFGGITDVDVSRLCREWKVAPEVVHNLVEREALVKLPRQAGQVIPVPNVDEKYVSPGCMQTFDEKIAENTNALLLEQVDSLLARPHNESTSNTKSTINDTENGWATRPKRK